MYAFVPGGIYSWLNHAEGENNKQFRDMCSHIKIKFKGTSSICPKVKEEAN